MLLLQPVCLMAAPAIQGRVDSHAILAEQNVMRSVQVAIEPSLLFENTYEPIPGYIPKEPTVSQVPTEIRGAVSMTIFNAGQSTIEVGSPSRNPPDKAQQRV